MDPKLGILFQNCSYKRSEASNYSDHFKLCLAQLDSHFFQKNPMTCEMNIEQHNNPCCVTSTFRFIDEIQVQSFIRNGLNKIPFYLFNQTNRKSYVTFNHIYFIKIERKQRSERYLHTFFWFGVWRNSRMFNSLTDQQSLTNTELDRLMVMEA